MFFIGFGIKTLNKLLIFGNTSVTFIATSAYLNFHFGTYVIFIATSGTHTPWWPRPDVNNELDIDDYTETASDTENVVDVTDLSVQVDIY